MKTSATSRIDLLNIGLLFLSAIIAAVIPFELFLFVYAVLGPLHYLTEISWLHDKDYFLHARRDAMFLVIISLLITVGVFRKNLGLGEWQINEYHVNRVIFVGAAAAVLFVVVKNNLVKWIGISILALISTVSDKLFLIFSIFLPTLLHVFVFTFFFMLYGAIKSRSKTGYIGAALHILIPFTFFFLLKDIHAIHATEYSRQSYYIFGVLNNVLLQLFAGVTPQQAHPMIFDSTMGIAIMRFIAFAYTYHYLNWFSKTEVIRWHKVPKSRFIFVVVLWVISIALYAIDYNIGFRWLFLLSFIHVMLELPLNFISARGILQSLKQRLASR